MSQSSSSTDHFGWSVYKGSPDNIREEFLRELDLDKNLPLVTWQGQVGMLDGAPADIILHYLPKVYWLAQVELYLKHLPVGRMKEAEPLLHDMAKRRLRIEVKKSQKTWKRWHY